MNLETKHLSPYLPYNLKVLVYGTYENKFAKPVIENLYGISDNRFFVGNKNIDGGYRYEFKPILRNIKNLGNEEIEVDGEIIEPLLHTEDEFWLESLPLIDEKLTDDHIENLLNNISYRDFQKLIKWHYDVFGLIKKGLAVDFKTANRQQKNIKYS